MFTTNASRGFARATETVAHVTRRTHFACANLMGRLPVNPDPVQLAAALAGAALIRLVRHLPRALAGRRNIEARLRPEAHRREKKAMRRESGYPRARHSDLRRRRRSVDKIDP
jgi:hypothetical protein